MQITTIQFHWLADISGSPIPDSISSQLDQQTEIKIYEKIIAAHRIGLHESEGSLYEEFDGKHYLGWWSRSVNRKIKVAKYQFE